jgi:hypothetical protein
MFVFSCIILFILMTGCAVSNTGGNSNAPAQAQPEASLTPEPPATPTAVPTPNEQEATTAIVTALLALYEQPNRMDVSTDLGGGDVRSNMIEFIPPDRKHIVDLDGGLEYLIVGGVVYAKTSDSGEWEAAEIPASSFLGDAVVTAETIAATISNARLVRRDTLDGIPVIVYAYDSLTRSNDIDLHSQTELWVGEQDGLPYKMIVDGEVLSAATDPQTGESKLAAAQALTTTLIEFDPSISIEAP